VTARPRGLAAGERRDGDALRAVAAELASRGFDTCPLDIAPTGEPTALHVRNPVNRAHAEVHAEDGWLELRCWCGPDDDDGIVARISACWPQGRGTTNRPIRSASRVVPADAATRPASERLWTGRFRLQPGDGIHLRISYLWAVYEQ
jgi:hypothetical protein